MFVQHIEFLQKVYKENHISELFLSGRKKEVIYLPGVLPSSIARCSCLTLQKANSPVLPEYITQAFSGHAQGVAFHPNLEVEAYMEHQPRGMKGCSQGKMRSAQSLCPLQH